MHDLDDSGFVRGYTGGKNILTGSPALAPPQKTPRLAVPIARCVVERSVPVAKGGVFWGGASAGEPIKIFFPPVYPRTNPDCTTAVS